MDSLSRSIFLVIGLAILFQLTGCASITSGGPRHVNVETHDGRGQLISGADCVLRNSKGEWRLRSPGGMSVSGASDNLVVRCDAENFDPGQASVISTAKAEMFGNVIIGGVIGALIDHASGAGYEYPSLIRVKMGDSVTIQPARNTKASTFEHAHPELLPVRTDWAGIEDVDAVPVSGRGHESYRRFLTSRYPRALAIGNGRIGWSSNTRDAADEAIKRCAGPGKSSCQLYAVDNYVVWSEKAGAITGVLAKRDNSPENKKTEDSPAVTLAGTRNAKRPASALGKLPGDAGNLPKPFRHDSPALIPPRTQWAAVGDIEAFPIASQRARDAYHKFLVQPLPRAFAIGPNGTWAFSAGRGDAVSAALTKCQTAKKFLSCRLYAVDDHVVWSDIFASDIQAATWLPQLAEEPNAKAGALNEISAVPYIDDRGRENYRTFLTLRSPRAFALSASGAFGFSSMRDDASERALQYCQKNSRYPCRLYAVDDEVVWPLERQVN